MFQHKETGEFVSITLILLTMGQYNIICFFVVSVFVWILNYVSAVGDWTAFYINQYYGACT